MNIRHSYQHPSRRGTGRPGACFWPALWILLFLAAFWGSVGYFTWSLLQ